MASLERQLRSQLQARTEVAEQQAIDEVNCVLSLLERAVCRLQDHRRAYGCSNPGGRDVDYMLVNTALRECGQLLKI